MPFVPVPQTQFYTQQFTLYRKDEREEAGRTPGTETASTQGRNRSDGETARKASRGRGFDCGSDAGIGLVCETGVPADRRGATSPGCRKGAAKVSGLTPTGYVFEGTGETGETGLSGGFEVNL